ncbi:nuclear transport factor 2 family protein [bacterium]|nr:nuclear transport factor 2 family protein [bacterium]
MKLKTAHHFTAILFIFMAIMINCDSNINRDDEKNGLLNTDREFAQMSVEEGAAEAFKHYLIENAMGMSHNQHPVFGRDILYQNLKRGQENYTLEWEPQRAEVAAANDMGWTWGKYVLTIKDDQGQKQKQYGKYLNIWERQKNGQWRVVVDMGNSSPAPVD